MSDHDKVKSIEYLISIGSNINPESNILLAAEKLTKFLGDVKFSSVWKSPAVGSDGPDFLNAAALFSSFYAADALKEKVLSVIESELDRVRTTDKYAPRTIDLDILIANGTVIDPELWRLAHLAVPADEIYPGLIHAPSGATLFLIAKMFIAAGQIQFCFDLKNDE